MKIIERDTLNYDWDMNFDVVVGNPPYQENERTKIWSDFVRLANQVTNDGGFISLIHPGSWKSYATPDSLLRDVFMKNKIHHLEIGTAEKYFSVSSSFDWYVMEKGSTTDKTRVVTEENEFEFDINSLPCIPNHFTKTSLEVTKKLVEETPKLDILKNRELDTYNTDYVTDEKNADFKYPVRHTKYTDKEVKWSSKEHSLQEEKKVLLTTSGYIRPEYDNGNYGVTQHGYYILVDEQCEGRYIIALLESNLFTYFREVNKQHGFHNLYLLRELPYVKGLDTENIDKELYDHFNLSNDEIEEIESFV